MQLTGNTRHLHSHMWAYLNTTPCHFVMSPSLSEEEEEVGMQSHPHGALSGHCRGFMHFTGWACLSHPHGALSGHCRGFMHFTGWACLSHPHGALSGHCRGFTHFLQCMPVIPLCLWVGLPVTLLCLWVGHC